MRCERSRLFSTASCTSPTSCHPLRLSRTALGASGSSDTSPQSHASRPRKAHRACCVRHTRSSWLCSALRQQLVDHRTQRRHAGSATDEHLFACSRRQGEIIKRTAESQLIADPSACTCSRIPSPALGQVRSEPEKSVARRSARAAPPPNTNGVPAHRSLALPGYLTTIKRLPPQLAQPNGLELPRVPMRI